MAHKLYKAKSPFKDNKEISSWEEEISNVLVAKDG